MRAVVTGSRGFVGKHLTTYLEEQGIEVIPLPHDELYSSSAWWGFLKKHSPDYIFHLAAFGNMSHQRDIMRIFHGNLWFTIQLLEASKDIPYKAFINVSSSSVLLDHETMYSATKAGAERLCKAFVDEYDKPIVTIRPFSIYGEGEADFRLIPTLFTSALEGKPITLDPTPMHDWVYVKDLCTYMWNVATHIEDYKGQALNAGTGIGSTNLEVMQLVEEITGKEVTITDYETLRTFDTPNWVSDTSIYGATSLKDGLIRYYKWRMGNAKGGEVNER